MAVERHLYDFKKTVLKILQRNRQTDTETVQISRNITVAVSKVSIIQNSAQNVVYCFRLYERLELLS